jgi:hypothetical protein
MQPSCQRDTGDKQGCADAHAGSVLGKIDLIGVPINIHWSLIDMSAEFSIGFVP